MSSRSPQSKPSSILNSKGNNSRDVSQIPGELSSPTTRLLANGDYFTPHSYSSTSTTHSNSSGATTVPPRPTTSGVQGAGGGGGEGPRTRRHKGKGMTFEEVHQGHIVSEEEKSLSFEGMPISEDEIKRQPKKLQPYYEHLSLLANHYREVDSLLSGTLPQQIAQSFSPQRNYLQRLGDLEEEIATPGSVDGWGRRHSAWKVKRSRITEEENGHEHEHEHQHEDGDEGENTHDETTERTGLLDGLKLEGKGGNKEERRESLARLALNVNTIVNIILVAAKAIAVLYSSSISLTASLVDSALDLLSTLIILGTSWAIGVKTDRHKYPAGKRRFEPLGVLIFSVAMIASFVQVFIESFQRTIAKSQDEPVDLSWLGVGVMLATIVIKLFLWIWCSRIPSSGVQALAQDAENDVFFNAMSLAFPWIGSFLRWRLLDPIGGMVLSTYIIVEWVKTLLQNFANLSGRSASRDQITRVLYLVTRFNPVIEIADVECYHIGDDLIVEIDVILPRSSSLHFAHDVGETIQCVLESLDGVIRAYVHCDYSSQNPLQHTSRPPPSLPTSKLRQASSSSSGSATPTPRGAPVHRLSSSSSSGQISQKTNGNANGGEHGGGDEAVLKEVSGSVPVASPQQI